MDKEANFSLCVFRDKNAKQERTGHIVNRCGVRLAGSEGPVGQRGSRGRSKPRPRCPLPAPDPSTELPPAPPALTSPHMQPEPQGQDLRGPLSCVHQVFQNSPSAVVMQPCAYCVQARGSGCLQATFEGPPLLGPAHTRNPLPRHPLLEATPFRGPPRYRAF